MANSYTEQLPSLLFVRRRCRFCRETDGRFTSTEFGISNPGIETTTNERGMLFAELAAATKQRHGQQ